MATVIDCYPNLPKKSEYFILDLDEALKLSIDGDCLLYESCMSMYTST